MAKPVAGQSSKVRAITVVVLASAMVSIGIAAFLGQSGPSQRGRDENPVAAHRAEVDTETPESTAETFLDAWRKRDFALALALSTGAAHDAVLAKKGADEQLSEEERQSAQKLWNSLAATRLRFVPRESERTGDRALHLRGEATGDFAGRPYRRLVEFQMAQAADGKWRVQDMVLSDPPDMPSILEFEPQNKAADVDERPPPQSEPAPIGQFQPAQP